MPKNVPAKYNGLQGKDVAVVVWADRPTRIDWPSIQIDICASLQNRLIKAQKDEKPDDLKDTTFPVTPQSIARFQLDHPEAEALPIADVARQVGVRRLIYIEITNFQTRSDVAASSDLFRGQLSANVKIIEIENGQPKTGYEENGISAKYPKKAPEEGALNIGEARTYVSTINEFTNTLAWRFYKHEEEREPGE